MCWPTENTHINTHILSLSFSLFLSPSLSHTLAFSCSLTHTPSLYLSLSHTHFYIYRWADVLADRDNKDDFELDDSRRLEQAEGILDRACQVTIYGCNVLMYFPTYNCYVPLRAGWRDPRSRVSGHYIWM